MGLLFCVIIALTILHELETIGGLFVNPNIIKILLIFKKSFWSSHSNSYFCKRIQKEIKMQE